MKHIGLCIKIAVSIGILAALFFRMDRDEAASAFQRFDPALIAFATCSIGLQAGLLALRWKTLINFGKAFLSARMAAAIFFASQLANTIFITSIGGLVARATLTMQSGAGLQKCVIASILDRALTFAALMFFSAIFLPSLASHAGNHLTASLAWYIAVVILILFASLPMMTGAVLDRLPPALRSGHRVRAGVRYLKVSVCVPKHYGAVLSLSLAAQAAYFLSVAAVTYSAHDTVDFIQLLAVLPVIALISSLPISIGGWGVREGAFVYGYSLLGIPMETAFLVSVQIGLIGLAVSIVMGIPAMLSMKFANAGRLMTNRAPAPDAAERS